MTDTVHSDTHIAGTVHEVQRRHPDHDRAEIERWVLSEFHVHDGDRVRGFIPILVARAVEDRLRRTSPRVTEPRPGGSAP